MRKKLQAEMVELSKTWH
ncbi:hypothetical protein Ahy_B09g095777 isoform B [Arachis hypogaea]|uniref:Uncharacterized protein n=1 Tax=Arachis hypogaea TaxID=3818 RepID=A0A444XGC2_ARAHY|nr:hypothetical protein Ahy_B09g095777 isoform B [Arachis hypogaea]